jgi:hypothetical protein
MTPSKQAVISEGWQVGEACWQAMEAGKRARKRGRKSGAAWWAKRHPLGFTMEELLAHAYMVGFTSKDRL